jgi:DNA-binding ferritin-like protein
MKTFLKFIKDKEPNIDKAASTVAVLQEVLGLLRGQYWNYWTSHWQVKGPNFYGNHLLFQRIYEGIQAEVDTLAEKIVGYFGEEHVENTVIMEKMHHWFDEWNKTKDPLDRAIQSEQDMQVAFKRCYDKLKEMDDISLGLDDFLMAVANAHETNLYLLQQANKKG